MIRNVNNQTNQRTRFAAYKRVVAIKQRNGWDPIYGHGFFCGNPPVFVTAKHVGDAIIYGDEILARLASICDRMEEALGRRVRERAPWRNLVEFTPLGSTFVKQLNMWSLWGIDSRSIKAFFEFRFFILGEDYFTSHLPQELALKVNTSPINRRARHYCPIGSSGREEAVLISTPKFSQIPNSDFCFNGGEGLGPGDSGKAVFNEKGEVVGTISGFKNGHIAVSLFSSIPGGFRHIIWQKIRALTS